MTLKRKTPPISIRAIDDRPWMPIAGPPGDGDRGPAPLWLAIPFLVIWAYSFFGNLQYSQLPFVGDLLTEERRLMEVTIVHPGRERINDLDQAFMRSEFDQPEERSQALERLVGAIDRSAIETGNLRKLTTTEPGSELLDRAWSHYQQQIKKASLSDLRNTDLIAARSDDPESEALVLGLIVSEPVDAGRPVSGNTHDAISFLARQAKRTSEPEALYVYYGPAPGETLSMIDAKFLAQKLK